MKYIACALPMLAGIEILSLICLCGLMVCVLTDIFKAAPKNFWR